MGELLPYSPRLSGGVAVGVCVAVHVACMVCLLYDVAVHVALCVYSMVLLCMLPGSWLIADSLLFQPSAPLAHHLLQKQPSASDIKDLPKKCPMSAMSHTSDEVKPKPSSVSWFLRVFMLYESLHKVTLCLIPPE